MNDSGIFYKRFKTIRPTIRSQKDKTAEFGKHGKLKSIITFIY